MKRYHYQREHYMCNVEHSVNVIDVVATVIDTLASCSEHMTREDMFRKVKDKLGEVYQEHGHCVGECEVSDEMIEEVVAEEDDDTNVSHKEEEYVVNQSNIIAEWLDDVIEPCDSTESVVKMASLKKEYQYRKNEKPCNEFAALARSWFVAKGYTYKSTGSPKINGVFVPMREYASGCRVKDVA
jgi:hypothetical protein